MIVFATSDKGGTGRSVTSCNMAYRLAMGRNMKVAYLDFDFGSPTAGALFEVSSVEDGTGSGAGLHSYLEGRTSVPERVNVRTSTDREALRSQRSRGGLTLFPGDRGGGETVTATPAVVVRCVDLLKELDTQFPVVIVDLSSGRSAAMKIALEATSPANMIQNKVRWLVFHRWTRQHVMAAHSLVWGADGIVQSGVAAITKGRPWYTETELESRIRYVRTAVPSLADAATASGGPQAAWVQRQDDALRSLAARKRLGAGRVLGETPVDPLLQWREQIILDADVNAGIANPPTAEAFEDLARALIDEDTWVPVENRRRV
ncbi:SCO2523 family variant P-loop protein [Nocardia sp. NPDC058666]|uniref:SCO2523 family variant P-loop protein n=1 Tax=unclassified Nocardia TaxID=2637762 RepID=UPI00364907F1